MALTVDYYFAPNSPWTYLGHERFAQIAKAAGATVHVLPVDLGGKVFPVTGGLPLAKRAPQRQAYRLVELKRFSEYLGAPIVLQPKFFPVNPDDAARLIIAVELHDGTDAAMHITDAVLRAVWADERNIPDEATLATLDSMSAALSPSIDSGFHPAWSWSLPRERLTSRTRSPRSVRYGATRSRASPWGSLYSTP